MDNLRNIDLNLLVTLEALLTERSVTRAAQRLNLSQPSVSVQLRKLRELFSDPLLAMAPGGMAPTPRALSLLPDLRASLGDMRRLLGRTHSFDPATARLTWHIGGSDNAEAVILLSLLGRLRRSAPGMSFASLQGSHARLFKQLDGGAIDLALMALDAVPDHLRQQVLFEEEYVLVVRKGHPAAHGAQAGGARICPDVPGGRGVQGRDGCRVGATRLSATSDPVDAALPLHSRSRGTDGSCRDAALTPRPKPLQSAAHAGRTAGSTALRDGHGVARAF